MKKELADRFNEEIERYRKALLQYAWKSDWDRFKTSAGKLFDYCEQVERSQLQERFVRIFMVVLCIVAVVVMALFKVDSVIQPDHLRLKFTVIFTAIAGSCFELFFFLNFRTYVDMKTRYYNERKERFIRDIERDFKMLRYDDGLA